MEKLSMTKILPELLVGAQDDIARQIMVTWNQAKVSLVVPFLRIFIYINLVMLIMLFTEKVYMALVVAFNMLFGKKPEQRYKFEPFEDDVELGSSIYPLVLVQVPMFNEKEVYQLSIGAACGLSWPSDRIVIQVLDDSTDPLIKSMVEMECNSWASKGINIHYQVRDNRKGYKAGALKEGLKHDYAKQCEYVVIFDADFQPEPDFLTQTIPFLHQNPELGLVQSRWKFDNSRYWTLVVPPGFKPVLNARLSSIESAIAMYEEYAQLAWFCTCLGTSKKEKIGDKKVTNLRYVLCSRANKPTEVDTISPKRRSNIKVTDCKACVKFKCLKDTDEVEENVEDKEIESDAPDSEANASEL